MRSTTFPSFFIFVVLASQTGCMLLRRPVPAVVARRVIYQVHTVKRSGETLGSISARYTGKSANWENILEANPGLDIKQIRVGDRIRIPAALIVPADPAKKSAAPAKTASPAPKTSAPDVLEVPPVTREIPVIRDPAAKEAPVPEYDQTPFIPSRKIELAPPAAPPAPTPDKQKLEEQRLKQRYEVLMDIIENENVVPKK